jgi:2-iminobutanoate/2-iminopropanoate deaminase
MRSEWLRYARRLSALAAYPARRTFRMPDMTVPRTALLCGIVLTAACGCSAPASSGAASPAQYFPSSVPNAPFSAAVRVGDVVYLSGQIGIGADGKLPGDFGEQAQQTMGNVAAALKQAGLGFDDVFKCTVMLADMSHWEDFNKIYVGYFKADRLPARSAVGANGLARGALVELECLARAHP